MRQAILAYWFIGLKRHNKALILISTDVFFVLFAFKKSLNILLIVRNAEVSDGDAF